MKYIIEFEDEPSTYENGTVFYACKQIPHWCMSKGLINRLTPYTEPDLNPLVDEAVETIENEVWEFVCKFVWAVDDKKILGTDILHAVRDMTYQEAKIKYEAWKKEKDEIRVGDEVELSEGVKGLVYIVGEEMLEGAYLNCDGLVPFCWSKKDCRKTGKHFDEIEELLKKVRDSDD